MLHILQWLPRGCIILAFATRIFDRDRFCVLFKDMKWNYVPLINGINSCARRKYLSQSLQVMSSS